MANNWNKKKIYEDPFGNNYTNLCDQALTNKNTMKTPRRLDLCFSNLDNLPELIIINRIDAKNRLLYVNEYEDFDQSVNLSRFNNFLK